MIQYFREILYLLGDDKKKLPILIVIFIGVSLLDLAGIGLIGPYVALVVSPDSLVKGRMHEVIKFLDLPLDQYTLLIQLGLLLVAVFLLKAVLAILINRTILVFSNDQRIRLQSLLMHSYQFLPYNNYLNRNSAEYIHAIRDSTNGFGTVLQTVLKTVSEGLVVLAIFVVLALTNGTALIFLVLLLGGFIVGYDRFFRQKIHHYGEYANTAATRMLQGIKEGIEGLKEIRILSKEQHFHKIVKSNASESAQYGIKSQLISTAPRYLLEVLLVVFIVCLVVGTLLMGQDLRHLIPTLGVFGIAGLRLMPSANILSFSLTQLRFNRYPISQLYADLNSLKESDLIESSFSDRPESFETFQNLTVRKVSFSYPNIKFPAINDVSLQIHHGESIGLVGASGSGKTTLVDIILGLLDPYEGELFYNRKRLSSSLAEWRSQVAYLPQEVFLIDNTLRHNVALGVDYNSIDDLRVQEALEQACLLELVNQLPNKMNTLLGERGVRLSGGQRQRVALARAFYHGRNVLVMDEATSALDNETEKEIVNEIKQFKGKKTMIVIAHRLTTVQYCDRIYRLENGTIVEQGSYEEVIQKIKHVVAV